MVDVKSKLCEKCNKQPSYGFEGEPPRFCSEHKLDDMVDVVSKRCEKCNKQPAYGFEGERPRFCNKHKLDDMVYVISKRCTYCPTFANNMKYEGMCLTCYIKKYPMKKVPRNPASKERAIHDFLRKEFPYCDLTHNKQIACGTSKIRPDFVFDLGFQVVVVACDETQHKTYDTSCESGRIFRIHHDMGRDVVLIRFNPDKYVSDKMTYPSCWGTDTRGRSRVAPKQRRNWDGRLKRLKKEVEKWVVTPSKKSVRTVHLFYDK